MGEFAYAQENCHQMDGAREMKVIFLDIDGVLNTWSFIANLPASASYQDAIDPEAVARLNRIVEVSGAKVVISSSWRRKHTSKDMQELLDAQGFRGEVIGRTGVFVEPMRSADRAKSPPVLSHEKYGFPKARGMSDYSYPERAFEVQAWLLDSSLSVDGFVILDDIGDWDWLLDHLVNTDPRIGLTDKDVDKAIVILNLETMATWPGPGERRR